MTIGFVIDGFAVDSATLTTAHKARLDKMVSSMLPTIYFSKSEYWLIKLVGSASQTGSDSYNMALSERRAKAVRDYISPKLAGSRVTYRIVGIGEMSPEDRKVVENARDRYVGVTAVLTGKLPPPPPPPPPPPKIEIKPRPPERKKFKLKVVSFLIQSIGVGIPKTPLDVHLARIAMNFTIDDGSKTQKYTFMGEGGGAGSGAFFLGGARSLKQGAPQVFSAYSRYECDDFVGRGVISGVTGQFLLGGSRKKKGWHHFPMGTIAKFKFPPSTATPGMEEFRGTISLGFKPLVPEFPKPLPPAGVF